MYILYESYDDDCRNLKELDLNTKIIAIYNDKEQAQAKFMEIYESEKDYVKSLGMQDTIVEWTGVYVGLLFDNNYENELNRREYYLQELEVK